MLDRLNERVSCNVKIMKIKGYKLNLIKGSNNLKINQIYLLSKINLLTLLSLIILKFLLTL